MKIELKIKNFSTGIVRFDDYLAMDELRDNFSLTEKNFSYIKRCRTANVRIDPKKEYIRKSVIKANGEFELGLANDILHFIANSYKDRVVNVSVSQEMKEYLKHKLLHNEEVTENNLDIDIIKVDDKGSKPRHYQVESMAKALKWMNGIYLLATGAGKTLCCSILCYNLLKLRHFKKILLVCPFPDLAHQTYEALRYNLQDTEYTVGEWFGKIPYNPSVNILVCGSDILRSKFEDVKKDLEKMDAVIVDEVHQLKNGNKISAIISKIPTTVKFGFTGTLPDNVLDKYSVIGKIGPVRHTLTSAELRAANFLTNVKALGIKVPITGMPEKKLLDNGKAVPFTYQDEVEWVSENDDFNEVIRKVVCKTSGNTLILVNRLIHGDKLFEMDYEGREKYYIKGEVSIDDRSDIKQRMEDCDNVVVIAQVSTFSTGINVKNIKNIIFPGIFGKSSIRTIQSIGRGLRLHENKEKLTVLDMIPTTKYCLKHSTARKEIYENEKIPYNEVVLK